MLLSDASDTSEVTTFADLKSMDDSSVETHPGPDMAECTVDAKGYIHSGAES